jgi:hypothetical protein
MAVGKLSGLDVSAQCGSAEDVTNQLPGRTPNEVAVTGTDLLNIANALGNGILWVAFACGAGGIALKFIAAALS